MNAGAAANGNGPPPSEGPENDAVLIMSDDVAFTYEELDRAFAVWSSNPERAVGFLPPSLPLRTVLIVPSVTLVLRVVVVVSLLSRV